MRIIHWLSALMALFSFVNVVDAEIIIPPPGLEPGDQYRLIFTTSQRRDATSSDINVYNDFVQSVADSSPELAALDSEWRALASTEDVLAIDNTRTNFSQEGLGLPIYRVDGQLWAPNYLFNIGGPFATLAIDERGQPITDFDGNNGFEDLVLAWTGAQPFGRLGGERLAAAGNALLAGPGPPSSLSAEDTSPDMLYRMYGVSAVRTVPIPEPMSDLLAAIALGVILFLSRSRYSHWRKGKS